MRGILAGMWLILTRFFRNYSENTTLEYPGEKRAQGARWKGRFVQVVDEQGRLRCDACQLCALACPDNLIEVLPEGKGRDKRPRVYTLNYAACHNCGLCVDICPSDAIRFSRDFETATFVRCDAFSHDDAEPLVYNLEDLVAFESSVYPELFDTTDPREVAKGLGYFANKNIFQPENYLGAEPFMEPADEPADEPAEEEGEAVAAEEEGSGD